jgi:NAD(P)-dependent dehydrogenase (short-subunit alcohol dehydrogenase family)
VFLAFTACLAAEVAMFNIRVLLLAPGAFRTEGMYSYGFQTTRTIADYDTLRRTWMDKYAAVPGTEPGDPQKAMEAVVDIMHEDGVAEGKESWPWCLILGKDGERDLNARWAKHQSVLAEWGDVTRGVWYEKAQMGL